MAISTAKLREEVLALTDMKVDIMLNDEEFKSTYQIMEEISRVWKDIADVDQAALLELLGGKRQANILSSMLTNFEVAQESLSKAMDSAGSAMAENEKYLDSIGGKLKQLEAAWESLSATVLSSELVKGVLDLAIGLTQAIDKIISALGSVEAFVGSAVVGITAKKGIGGVFAAIAKGSGVAEAAMLGLKGGFVGLGIALAAVMGIKVGTWLWDIADSSHNAEKRIKDLSDEVSSMESKESDFASLAKQFENLSQSTEKTQEYYDVQNQLHDLLPSLKGYYDEHGNYIITETKKVETLTATWKDYIAQLKNTTTQEYLRDPLFGDSAYQNDLEDYKEKIQEADAIRRYIRVLDRFDENGQYVGSEPLSPEDDAAYIHGTHRFGDAKTAASNLREVEAAIDSATDELQQHALVAAQTAEGWADFSEEEKLAIEQWVDSADISTVQTIFEKYQGDAEAFVQYLKNEASQQIESTKNQVESTSNSPYPLSRPSAGQIDISSYATHEKAVESLAKAYVEFLENAEVTNQTLAELQETFGNCGEDWDTFLNRLASIDQLDTADYLAELNAELKKLQQGGNVDLLNRPQISTQILKDVGWSDAGDGYATLYSSTYSNEDGTKAINFTPIFTNPETGKVDVLSPESLENYANGVLEGVHDDYWNLQIGAEFVGEDAIERAAEAGNYIHELHEILYADSDEQITMLEDLYSKEDIIRNATERLAESYLNEKIALGEVNDQTKAHIQSMLESIGVTNADIVATQALNESQKQVVQQIIAQQTAKADANMTSEEFRNAVLSECELLGIESAIAQTLFGEINNTAAAKIAASMNGDFLTSTQEEIDKLIEEAIAAGMAKDELLKLYQAEQDRRTVLAAEEAGISTAASRAAEERLAALQDEADQLRNQAFSFDININSSDAYKKFLDDTKNTTGKVSQEFQSMYDQLQAMREANLIGEEEYLQRLFELNQQYNRNNVSAYRQYSMEIFNGMKSMMADRITAKYDSQISSLESERAEAERYYDGLIDAEQDKLDLLRQEWETEEHLLKIEKARAELARAQQQKNVRVYREGKGFVWEADQEKVQDATATVNNALKEYERYQKELAIEKRIEQLEELKEKVLESIDQQIEAARRAKEEALKNLEELQFGAEAFLQFLEMFGIEVDDKTLAMIKSFDLMAEQAGLSLDDLEGSLTDAGTAFNQFIKGEIPNGGSTGGSIGGQQTAGGGIGAQASQKASSGEDNGEYGQFAIFADFMKAMGLFQTELTDKLDELQLLWKGHLDLIQEYLKLFQLNGLYVLQYKVGEMVTVISEHLNTLKTTFSNFSTESAEALKPLVDQFNTLFMGQLENTFDPGSKEMLTWSEYFAKTMDAIIEKFKDWRDNYLNPYIVIVKEFHNWVMTSIKEEVEAVTVWRDALVDALTQVEEKLDALETSSENAKTALENLKTSVDNLASSAGSAIGAVQSLASAIDALHSKTVTIDVITRHRTVGKPSIETTKSAGGTIKETTKSAGGTIKETTKSAGGTIKETINPDGSISTKRYASGVIGLSSNQWALTDEEGPELVIPGKGTFRRLKMGSSVLPADVSRNLWAIGQNPIGFASGIANMISNRKEENKTYQVNVGDIILHEVQNARRVADELKGLVLKAEQLAYSK